MIINLKKYLFIGAREDLADFFIRAQDEGIIEFLSPDSRRKKELSLELQRLIDAIKILRKQPVKARYTKEQDLPFCDEIAAIVMELKAEVEKLSEERRYLHSEIARVGPFGDFSMEDVSYLETETGRKMQFYCVKTSKAHEIAEFEELIYVGTDYDLDYYIAFNKEPKHYPGMIEMHVERSVSELKDHLVFVEETLHQVEAELKGYAGHIELLRGALLERLDISALEHVKGDVSYPIKGSIFSIEGWVPENKADRLMPLIEGSALFFEPIARDEGEKIPTHMENSGLSKIGEDLVKIYDVPSATDKDPSAWVFWAFALFFAMILADGGYGLLYLGLAFFLKHKLPDLKAGGKRFLKMLFILSSGCVLWGLMTSSFFGINFAPDSPISKISLIHYLAEAKAEYHYKANDSVHKFWIKELPKLKGASSGKEMLDEGWVIKGKTKAYVVLDNFNDTILLELSLLIGVVHVSLGLLRYTRRSLANLGWVAFVVGGYLYFPVSLKATSIMEFMGVIHRDTANTIGLQLLYGGMGLAVVLALVQKRLKGMGEIVQLIQVFADVLSYLRLYALALASTIMARTFNEMG
ncbi:MAG: hypothetical protein K940chlam2_01629, partial [Chlamydiae bacterium]|nr:hypothetical protein [Chlamydiota bacterium]